MKKKQKLMGAVSIAAVFVLLCVTAFAADPGSKKDPLVTLSYLEEVFFGEVMDKVDEEIDQRNKDIAKEVSATVEGSSGGESFHVVTLEKGQILMGEIGCEVMLRVGTAVCYADSAPGLIDETNASTLNDGAALERNHMYMMTIEDRGVEATADTVKVLVRGGYTVE